MIILTPDLSVLLHTNAMSCHFTQRIMEYKIKQGLSKLHLHLTRIHAKMFELCFAFLEVLMLRERVLTIVMKIIIK